jgi:lipopolysaccharide/colanic/teichoic acid biosynthesis glycosyltransferase
VLKRGFDIFFSGFGIVLLCPILIIVAISIKLESSGPIFYIQKRVGLKGVVFGLFKFRTMFVGSDKQGLLTVGARDTRITKVGYYLRKYKLDELPQLFNVFIGSMSLVGPRPEVPKYVELYTEKQREILSVKPGITDFASIHFSNENEILALSDDPELLYINRIMAQKIRLNKLYIRSKSIKLDFVIILMTLHKIFK